MTQQSHSHASASSNAQAQAGSHQAHAGKGASAGVSDQEYDLISLVYHALQSADVYDMYAQDAQEAGNQELQDLVNEAREQNMAIAGRARELLKKQIAGK